jgi:hypothetical protein
MTVAARLSITPTLNPNVYYIERAARVVNFTAPVHRAFSSPHENKSNEDRISHTLLNTRWHH